MASTLRWDTPESFSASYITTTLNSLANGSYAGVGAAIDNETDKYTFINVEVNLATLTPTAGGTIEVWINYSIDATNYLTGSKSTIVNERLCSIPLDTAAGAQRVGEVNLPVAPLKFKLDVRNNAGVALNSSGNTLGYRRHNGFAT